jgi:hypothetical protein
MSTEVRVVLMRLVDGCAHRLIIIAHPGAYAADIKLVADRGDI